MRYIKYFEATNPGKFYKIVPINRNGKIIYRNQKVGSIKNFTKQHFLYLEKVFGDKLQAYQNWLTNVFKLNYYTDKDIFVNNNKEIFRLFPIDIAYRKYLLKKEYPGINGVREIAKLQQDARLKYLKMIFAKEGRPDIYSISHIKGGMVNSTVDLKSHPFMYEIELASNPPNDLEKANVVADTEIGKKILSKKEREENIEKYHRNKAINIAIDDINKMFNSIDYKNITGSEFYDKLSKSKIASKVYFGKYILTNDSELIIIKNGKEYIRNLKQLMDYLKTIPNNRIYLDKIELKHE